MRRWRGTLRRQDYVILLARAGDRKRRTWRCPKTTPIGRGLWVRLPVSARSGQSPTSIPKRLMSRHPRRLGPKQTLLLTLSGLAAILVFTSCVWAAPSAFNRARRSARSACRRAVHNNVTRDTCPGTVSLAGLQFWRNPTKPVVALERKLLQERQWAEASQIDRIAYQPQATWFAGPVSEHYIRRITGMADKQHKAPVDVLYDLPWRGCGQAGAGGAAGPRSYRRVVDAVARGIGHSRVVMIVEPDALSEINCLSRRRRADYYSLIRFAITRLSGDRNAAIYVDAGHPDWIRPRVMARRLLRVARSPRIGFAVNVSNYYPTWMDVDYGTGISRNTHGKHFVIDTSRNGGFVKLGAWCNPSGAKIGAAPTTDTGNPLVDAELWIKPPGASDGTCNGGPPAGDFWVAEALALTSQ